MSPSAPSPFEKHAQSLHPLTQTLFTIGVGEANVVMCLLLAEVTARCDRDTRILQQLLAEVEAVSTDFGDVGIDIKSTLRNTGHR